MQRRDLLKAAAGALCIPAVGLSAMVKGAVPELPSPEFVGWKFDGAQLREVILPRCKAMGVAFNRDEAHFVIRVDEYTVQGWTYIKHLRELINRHRVTMCLIEFHPHSIDVQKFVDSELYAWSWVWQRRQTENRMIGIEGTKRVFYRHPYSLGDAHDRASRLSRYATKWYQFADLDDLHMAEYGRRYPMGRTYPAHAAVNDHVTWYHA